MTIIEPPRSTNPSCDSCGAMREAVAIVDFDDGSEFTFLVCEPCSRAADRPGVHVVWLEDVR